MILSIMEAGMTHGTEADGMILITTEDGTAGMTRGITEAIGTIIITADGTEDGTRIGATIITAPDTTGRAGTYTTAQDMRPDRTG